jgi:hypothetical protein
MEDLPRCCIVDGAKMNMSRWRRSHQKRVDKAGDDEEVSAVVIERSIHA